MTSRIGKRTTAILAFIALAFSVIVPLSIPKAFSAPDCHNAEAKDFDAKIEKVVSDLAASVREKGEYVYGSEHFPELNSIVPGFGMYREITKVIKGNGYTFEDIFGQGAQFKAVSLGSGGGLETPKVEIHMTSPTKTFDEAKFKDAVSKELAKFLKENPREICEPDKDDPIVEPTKPSESTTKPSEEPTEPGDIANLKDYEAKIAKVVSDFAAVIKNEGSYTYRVVNERTYSPALDAIAPGFGEGREIPLLIENSKYSLEDILGKGASGYAKSHSNVTPDGKTVSGGEHMIYSLTKTVDEAKLKEIIADELAKFLADSPKPGDSTKPGCKKAEIKDYSADIEKAVDRIGKPISGDNNYLWAIYERLGASHNVKVALDLTDEQVKQVFGDSAESSRSMTGPAIAIDENDKTYTTGGPTVYFGVNNATKFDRAAMTKIITDKVAAFLAKNPQEICEGDSDPKPDGNPKPGCKKAEVKYYKEKINQAVDKIGKPWRENYYSWGWDVLYNIIPAFKSELILTDVQTEQVFGKGARLMPMLPPAIDLPDAPKVHWDGEWAKFSRIDVDYATKFDREAMTKIITDKVSEFLAKNPQEICESGSDTKPGTTEPTMPGTDEPITEPTKPGDNPKPGDDTKPGTDEPTTDPPKPGTDEPTELGTDSKADAEPADTGSDTSEPAVSDNKPGVTATTDEDSNPSSGAAANPEGEQTVLEGATEAGGLATTGAVGLIALGVAVVLIGAGAALAIRHRKRDM